MSKKRKRAKRPSRHDSNEGKQTVTHFHTTDYRGRPKVIKVCGEHRDRYDLKMLAHAIVVTARYRA